MRWRSGIAKAGLEYLTISTAAILAKENISVNCYRIDWPVATEGNLMNFPDADHSTWADPAAAADGAVWMLDRPVDWTGRIVSMLELAQQVPSIAELGREPFELPGPWTLTGRPPRSRGVLAPVTNSRRRQRDVDTQGAGSHPADRTASGVSCR